MGKNVDKGLVGTWEKLGQADPLWAILMESEKKGGNWKLEEFFEEGKNDVRSLMNDIDGMDIRLARNRALDFGCGVGRLSQALCEYFNEVHGVDVSQPMIELADKHNRYPDKCSYYLNTADDLGIFETGGFDFILTLITLQHMKPGLIRGYLKEFLRLLSSDGLLVFQLPSHMQDKIVSDKPKPDGTLQNIFAGLEKHIYDRLPRPIRATIRRFRYFVLKMLRKPVVEMHGISKDKLLAFLEASGASVVDVRENDLAGYVWESFTYYVKK